MSEESKKRLSRRRFVTLTGGALVASGILAACGDNTATTAPAAATTAAGSATTAAGSATTAAAGATTAAATTAAAGATTAAAGATTAAAPAPTATPYPTVAQAAGSTKIVFWHGFTGFNAGILQQIVNKYNTTQQKYYVQTVANSNYDDTIAKFRTALAGGDLPNVVQIYDIGTQAMIDTKKIIPVSDFIAKDNQQAIVDDIEPAVASYYTVNKVLYSMPLNSSTPVMYYNKAAFKEVGLDPDKPPTTFSAVMDAAKKLVKKDGDKITRGGVDFSLYGWILEQEHAEQGALLAEPDNGRSGTRANKLVFNGEAGQTYLNFLKSILDNGLGRSWGRHSGTTANTTIASNFATGQTAMTFESIATLRSFISSAASSGKGVDVGVAPLPKPDNAPGGVIIGGASIWITTQGDANTQAGAWDFVKFTAQPEQQSFFASNTGYYPTRKAAYNLQEMKDALAKYPQFQVAIDQLHNTKASPATAGAVFGSFSGSRQNVEAAMDNFMTGKASSAKAALDDAANKENDRLTEYNSTVK
ncbi:MAG: ABC transporter substrate-binding protein [Chloroflexi bacterium]|nr:ABC transporter substrate-binding protein [Chloroflexota bacterium]